MNRDDKEINIKQIFIEIKLLKNFNQCFKPILLEYLRKAIFYELDSNFIIEYINFLCEQALDNGKLEENTNELNKSQLNQTGNVSLNCYFTFLLKCNFFF